MSMTEARRYSLVAILLHWAIAGLILLNFAVAWRMEDLKGLAKFEIFQLHKSIGFTVLTLSVLRLLWRLVNRAPPLPSGMPSWQRAAAIATHWGFYAVMIFMPLTGWIMVSVSDLNIPTLVWGVVPWPHFEFLHELPKASRKAIGGASHTAHMALAIGALLLFVLHVAAALKHQLVDRDGLMGRMIPGLGARSATE